MPIVTFGMGRSTLATQFHKLGGSQGLTRLLFWQYVPGQLNAINREARRIRLVPLWVAGEVVAGPRDGLRRARLGLHSRANDVGMPGVVEHCHGLAFYFANGENLITRER